MFPPFISERALWLTDQYNMAQEILSQFSDPCLELQFLIFWNTWSWHLAAMLLSKPKQPQERPLWKGTENPDQQHSLIPSQPTVSTNVPPMWASHLRNRSWSPSWAIPADSTWNKNKLGPHCRSVSKLNYCYYFGGGLLYKTVSPECPNLNCPNCKLTLLLPLFPPIN